MPFQTLDQKSNEGTRFSQNCHKRCYVQTNIQGLNLFILQILVHDQNAGTAELKASQRLNCEEKKSYQFNVQAISCSGSFSER